MTENKLDYETIVETVRAIGHVYDITYEMKTELGLYGKEGKELADKLEAVMKTFHEDFTLKVSAKLPVKSVLMCEEGEYGKAIEYANQQQNQKGEK